MRCLTSIAAAVVYHIFLQINFKLYYCLIKRKERIQQTASSAYRVVVYRTAVVLVKAWSDHCMESVFRSLSSI